MWSIRQACTALLLGLTLLPQGALAADTVLESKEKWVVDYANDSCRLARAFGKDEGMVVLVIDQFMPAGMLNLSLIGKRLDRFEGSRTSLSTSFGPGLPVAKPMEALVGRVGPDKTAILMIGPRDLLNRSPRESGSEDVLPTTPEQEAAITELRVAGTGLRFTLHTGSMAAPLAAMRTCTADLVKTWGLDPAEQEALSKRPEPITSPAKWLNSNDYPKDALFKGASAIVRFRMMVGADGLPTKCVIQQATQSPEFTKLTCDLLMRRARFTPPLDREGKPAVSYYTNSVRWVAP